MIQKLPKSIVRSSLLFTALAAAFLSAPFQADAQLPYSQTFMTNAAPGLVFGGTPAAFLTAGQSVNAGGAGTVTDPTNGGYLRLTSAANNNGGFVYNNTPFPSQNGLKVSFEYFAYAGSIPPADGFSFFLFDAATTTFNIGAFGGALGYQSYTGNSQPGVSNGYLGIGLDAYGNYSPSYGAHNIGVRGPGNGLVGYDLLTASNMYNNTGYTVSSGSTGRLPLATQSGYRKAFIELVPKAVPGGYSYDITVKIAVGTGASTPTTFTIINSYTGFSTVAPANLKYGFAASTGGLNQVHEIRNLDVTYYTAPANTPTANNDVFSSCHGYTNTFNVLSNDVPVNAPLAFDSTSVLLINPANSAQSGNSYTIAGVGTFTTSNAFGSKGNVSFVADPAFTSGSATISYTVKDNYSVQTNVATITVNASTPITSNTVSYDGSMLNGATATGGPGPISYSWVSAPTTTSVYGSATGTNNGQHYTPPAAPGMNTYFRRVANSGGCLDSSATVFFHANGQIANALDFDGVNDYVVSANNIGITGHAPRTVEFHARIINDYDHYVNWGATNATNNPFGMYSSGGQLKFYGWGTGDFNVGFVPDGNFHHVAVSYDRTNVRVYIDGVLTSAGAVARNMNTTDGKVYIGIREDMNAGTAAGTTIDEVRIWNRALCQAEIQQNMTGSLSGSQGLVLNYRMNLGSPAGNNTGITTIPDASGNGNNGTLTNFSNTGTTSNFVSGRTTIITNGAPYAPSNIATSTEEVSKTVSGATLYNNCGAIATVTPSGAAQVSGTITPKVFINGTVPTFNSQPYVRRYYDITPASGANTATATITLYFTQADFDTYNATANTPFDLPLNSGDNAGKANLKITQHHGTSATGLPGSFTGWGGAGAARIVIDPLDNNIVWNGTASRWEVTFNVTGFSGFFAYGSNDAINPLPIKLETFSAIESGSRNRIDWRTAVETGNSRFEVQRSSTGSDFRTIGEVGGKGPNSSYAYYDNAPLAPVSYYRLHTTDGDGKAEFSSTVAVRRSSVSTGAVSVSPVPATSTVSIINTDATLVGSMARVFDVQGREVYRFTLSQTNIIDISSWTPGVYSLRMANGEVVRVAKD